MTMFCSWTPAECKDLRAPATRAEMISVFHRACTMAMRRPEPKGVTLMGAKALEGPGLLGNTIMYLGFTRTLDACHIIRGCLCVKSVSTNEEIC